MQLDQTFTFIRSGTGDDIIRDSAGDDVMFGEGGNDIFHYTSGNDLISGGTGYNILNVSGSIEDFSIHSEYFDTHFDRVTETGDARGFYFRTLLTDGSAEIRLSNIHEVIFDDGRLQLDLYPDNPTFDQPTQAYGLGEVIPLKGGIMVEGENYSNYEEEYFDYIPFNINDFFINDDTQILISIDRLGFTEDYHRYNELNVGIVDQVGRSLSLTDMTILEGQEVRINSSGDGLQYDHWSSSKVDLVIDPGYFGGLEDEAFKLGGDFFIKISNKQYLNEGSLSLSYYHQLTESADSITIEDAFFDGKYIAGLAGDDDITGSLRSEIIDGGSGADTLRGMGGDDTFIINSNSTNDIIDGGGHRVQPQGGDVDTNNATSGELLGIGDSLKLANSTDLTTINFSGIESLSATSNSTIATVSADQFNSLLNFDYLQVKIEDGSSVNLGSKNFLNGAVISGSNLIVDAQNDRDNDIVFAGGDNRYTGGSKTDLIHSSGGDDILATGAGNDVITDTGGNNTINTGDGSDRVTLDGGTASDVTLNLGADDDELYFSSAVTIEQLGSFTGGEGLDTLHLSHGSSDLSNIDFSGFERVVIEKYGVYTFAAGELENITFEYLAGAEDSYVLEKIVTPLDANTGNFSESTSKIGVSGSEERDEITGTNFDDLLVGNGGDDFLSGGTGNDVIFGGEGADHILGGAGADEIHPDAGSDIIIAGDGSDKIYLGPENTYTDYSTTITTDETYIFYRENRYSLDKIDGGLGTDYLYVETAKQSQNTFYFDENISGIEYISITGADGSYLSNSSYIFDGDLFEGLQKIEAGYDGWSNNIYILSNHNNVDLSKIESEATGAQQTYNIFGTVLNLDATGAEYYNNYITDNIQYDYFKFGDVNLLTTGPQGFAGMTSDTEFSIDGNIGNDSVSIRNNALSLNNVQNQSFAKIKVDFDGGDGEDTLRLEHNIVDITESNFTDVENIAATGSAIIATQEQFNTLNIVGSASKFIRGDDFLLGTAADDIFIGSGIEHIAGGDGDDTIYNVYGVYFSGNREDYQYQKGQNFEITHRDGSGADGTDTLYNVQALYFDNGSGGYYEEVIDDFTSWNGSVRENYERALLFGGRLDYFNRSNTGETKVDSGVTEFDNDIDVFYTELAPHSPMDVEVGSTGNWYTYWYDVDTEQQLHFWSPVTNDDVSYFAYWMSDDKERLWTPRIQEDGEWQKYDGGNVVLYLQNSAQGDYTIGLELFDDYYASTSTTGLFDPERGEIKGYISDTGEGLGYVEIENGGQVQEVQTTAIDRDWVAIELVQGTTYEFEVIGLSGKGGTLVDPHLNVRNDNGTLVLHTADGYPTGAEAVGNDVFTEFTADYTGIHFLDVGSGLEAGGTNLDQVGSWTMLVRSKDQYSADVNTTGFINLDSSNRGTNESEINSLGDRDWFRVHLEKGLTYQVEALGKASGSGSLDDPEVEILSTIGLRLAGDDDSGLNADASAVYAPTISGYYYIGVAGSGNSSTGTYQVRVTSVPDDYAGDMSTDAILTVDQPTKGMLQTSNDKDWFKVGLTEGNYILKAYADNEGEINPLRDPYLILRDETGQAILWSDDSRNSLDSEIYFQVSADTAGAYYLEVQGGFKYDIGSYEVLVETAPADDYADTLGSTLQTGTLVAGELLTAGLQAPGDLDLFAFTAEPGVVYRFDVMGYAGIASSNATVPVEDILADPMMRIFGERGELILRADDGGLGGDARAYYKNETTQDETLYLQVSSSNPNQLGTYKVEYNPHSLVDNDIGDIPADAKNINLGDTLKSELLTRGDADVFAVDLIQDERYVFHLRGAGTGEGTLVDPYLELLSGDNGVLTADKDDNSGWYENSRISYVAESSGTYYLKVTADEPEPGEEIGTGSYTLITREPDDHSDTSGTATEVQIDGEALSGRINYNDGIFGAAALGSVARSTDADIDWFKIEAAPGQIISVNVNATETGATSRPMFEIVKNQTIIARGDGKETGNIASTAFEAIDGGSYYLAVVDGAGGTGNYTVQAVSGDIADEDYAVQVVALGGFPSGSNNITTSGHIGISGDVDTYAFDATQGHSYRLIIDGARDGSSAPLESIKVVPDWVPLEDGETAIGAKLDGSFSLQIDATENASLQFAISSFNIDTGKYFIELVDLGTLGGDDYADSIDVYSEFNTDIYSIGEIVTGQIEESGDLDLIEVSLTSGQRYELVALGFNDDAGTLALPELTLLNSDGVAVATGFTDLDAGRSTIETSVFSSGDYYIQVGAKEFEGNLGSYTLQSSRVEFEPSDNDAISGDATTGYTISKGQLQRSEIDYFGDIDWFAADLEGEKTYKVDVLALGADYGTLTDSELRIISSDGIQIAYDNNSGAAKDSEIIFTTSEAGKYFIEVAGEYNDLGSYALRLRELYSGEADPLAAQQTYLDALGLQYISEYSGAGITVGVIDDGIEYNHPDLMNQIDFTGDMDAQFRTETAIHKYPDILIGPPDAHGTPVAGIIAAEQGNETGVVGIAPDADIAATRVKWAMPHMIGALQEQVQFDVSNNSWGAVDVFADDFNRADWMMGYQAIRYAVDNGRDGDGTVFIFSAGNSRAAGDNVNYHNFQNTRETITVAATEIDGTVASFSTPGSAILVGAYGVDLLTTDRLGELGYNVGDYTNFTGTSAAAPVVSGVVSLMLEANADLGYRDIQKILAYSAWHPDEETIWSVNQSQTVNLGGMRFNDDLGFGVVDARAAVRLAESWTQYGNARNEVSDSARQLGIEDWIPDEGASLEYTFNIDSHIEMEHAVLSVDIAHSRLGDLELELISPDGTVSTLIDRPTVTETRPLGLYGEFSDTPGRIIFDLSSVQYMGEDSFGDWTVRIADVRAEHVGLVRGLSLNVYGAVSSDDNQYVITDEYRSAGIIAEIRDDAGFDILNGAALTKNFYVDLNTKEAAVGAHQNSDGYWEGGERFTISDWTQIEAIFGGDGDDQLIADAFDNTIRAGKGDDLIVTGIGSDIVYGGSGTDCVIYDFDLATAQSRITYNQLTECILVSGGSGDQAWLDQLYGIEKLALDGYEILVTSLFPDDPINSAPVVNIQVLNEPISVGNGQSLKLELPEDIFTDENQDAKDLAMSLALIDENGDLTELPDWLHFNEQTGTLEGEPDASAVGRYRFMLKAEDDFGAEASKEIIIEIGDNRAPIVENPRSISVEEDHGLLLLGIAIPTDPDLDQINIQITEIPAQGEMLLGTGVKLNVGDAITPDQLAGLAYQTSQNFSGNAGQLKYTAIDARNVASSTSISFDIAAVNDKPTFGENSQITLSYDGEALLEDLSLPIPTDAEETISQILVTDLPVFGELRKINGEIVIVGETLNVDELESLRFFFDQSVNGPIGRVGLSATDLIGAEGEWAVELLVNGNQTLAMGDELSNELYGSTGADQVFALGGNDLIFGNAGGDEIYAGSGADKVYGGSGGDTIKGGNGDDYIDGGTGADLMFGGLGDDTYIVDDINDLVYEVLSSAAGGFDTIRTNISISLPQNVESAEALGDNDININGNSFDNILVGNKGNNSLFGDTGHDVLIGDEGDDTLDGSFGRDQMLGGLGNDTYIVDSRSDVVTEAFGAGVDTVKASVTTILSSNIENLTLTGSDSISGGGNALDNHIIGNEAANLISGGLGADLMEGGLGDDIYVISEIGDEIIDIGGIDTVRTTIDLNFLASDLENIEIIGLDDVNAVGNQFDNEILGNSGSNIIDSSSGSDTITGGFGSDVFIFSSVQDGDQNIITDFKSGEDIIAIDAVGLGLFNPVDMSGLWIVETGFNTENLLISSDSAAADANDYLRFDPTTNELFVDPDANGYLNELLVVKLANISNDISENDILVTI